MANQETDNPIPEDLIEEYAEVGISQLIEEGKHFLPILDPLGSEIPYVKTLIAAIKFPRTLSDFLLGKKVNAFLFSSNMDAEKINKFKDKFSKAKRERLWEQVVFSLNAHDDKKKSEIIGKLFTVLVNEQISENEFYTLVHATNSLNMHNLDDIKQLYMLSDNFSLPGNLYYTFATLGLIDIDNSQIGLVNGSGPTYPLNQTGWKYIGIVYDFPDSSITGIKIGEDELIAELNDQGQITNKAYPIRYLQEKGSGYREVDLFKVRQDGQILCDSTTGLPYVVDAKIVTSGQTPQRAVEALVNGTGKLKPVYTRNMEDTPVQKWAYILKSDESKEGTEFKTILAVQETITNSATKNDQTRYFMDLSREIERNTIGEVGQDW